MTWFAAFSLLVVAQPLPELKVAAPGLTTTGLDASVAAPLTNHLARAFTGVRVITPGDISALLGLERQKQLLGCADDATACMAELGNALGVQGVLLGDVVKLGKVVQVNARIIDPVGGQQLATASARVEDEAALFDALTKVGRDLSAQFLAAMGRAPVAAPIAAPLSDPNEPKVLAPDAPIPVTAVSRGSRRFFPMPLALGGASLAACAAFFILAEGEWQRLTEGPVGSLSIAEAEGVVGRGKTDQLLGATFAAVGAVAVAAGVGLLLFGSRGDDPGLAVSFTPTGLSVAGGF